MKQKIRKITVYSILALCLVLFSAAGVFRSKAAGTADPEIIENYKTIYAVLITVTAAILGALTVYQVFRHIRNREQFSGNRKQS